MDLRYDISLNDAHLINAIPEFGDLGINGARRIVPGFADSSLLYLRMTSTNEKQMPPLAVSITDPNGAKLIAEWINNMQPSYLPADKMPDEFKVIAYPNPFNPNVNIQYNLATQAFVEIEIFNILGNKIITLIKELKNPGTHYISWDAQDQYNRKVPSGIYFYRIIAISQTHKLEKMNKIILLK